MPTVVFCGTLVVLSVSVTTFTLPPERRFSLRLVVLTVKLSYVPVTAASFTVLVDGYCLPVPGYIILTAPGAPSLPRPVAGLPLYNPPDPPPPYVPPMPSCPS